MKRRIVLLLAALALAPADECKATVQSATPFADNMVLQRDRPVPVWGRADPGESVTVSFAGQKKTTTAGADGTWRIDLDKMPASKENRTMTIAGWSNTEEIKNVLVGEVWFASGQSNMECPIWGDNPRYRDANGAIMTQITRRPLIRYVNNGSCHSSEPRLGWKAAWRQAVPQSFKEKTLSAVAFYFALEIYGALEIPVGIIESSRGGSRIEYWTPPSPGHPPFGFKPTLFNGTAAAFAPFAVRGLIWYQGCNNAADGESYAAKMHALYNGWAKAFENQELRLYFVQLAPYKNDFHLVRLGQAKFAAEEKNAAMAVACDAGNLHDIHPNGKEIIAKRLAILALKRDYGFTDIVADSPTLENWRVENGKFILHFNNATGWYIYRPDATTDNLGFEIAGSDGKFVPAKLVNKIDKRGSVAGSRLVIAADGIQEPCQLRYLATKPWTGALYSSDSALPLGPLAITNVER